MRDVTDDLKEQLEDDLLYHAWIVQCVADTGVPWRWEDVVRELLADGIEIGTVRTKSPDYLEFVAWTGSIESRLSRAVACVESAAPHDAGFAYWLCLSRNVDHYEDAVS